MKNSGKVSKRINAGVLTPDFTLKASLAILGRYSEARKFNEMALAVMEQNEGCEPERAITYLNMASSAEAENGLENSEEFIKNCVLKADALLETPGLARDGNYAFVCEKCAPVFGYYGYFLLEKKYAERAKEIYERA